VPTAHRQDAGGSVLGFDLRQALPGFEVAHHPVSAIDQRLQAIDFALRFMGELMRLVQDGMRIGTAESGGFGGGLSRGSLLGVLTFMFHGGHRTNSRDFLGLAAARAVCSFAAVATRWAAGRVGTSGGGALVVMLDQAAGLADEIVAANTELARRRADLEALSQLLSNEARRLNGPTSPPLPALISQHEADTEAVETVLHGTSVLAPTDWAARFRELCEAPVDDSTDTPQPESQQSSP